MFSNKFLEILCLKNDMPVMFWYIEMLWFENVMGISYVMFMVLVEMGISESIVGYVVMISGMP